MDRALLEEVIDERFKRHQDYTEIIAATSLFLMVTLFSLLLCKAHFDLKI